MTPRGSDDDWVAPVTRLFGAPATRTEDDEGWFVPDTAETATEIEPTVETEAGETGSAPRAGAAAARPVEPEPVRRLPTFADFDLGSTASASSTGVLEAKDRFAARRSRAGGPRLDDEPDEESPRRRIENVSTAALARRGLSESEVRSRLIEKGFTAEQVEPEVQRLLRAGYLDDRKLAEEIIRVEAERKGKGRSAIVAELRRRGVDPEAFADAVAELDPDDEVDRAQELVRKKLSSLRNVDDETAKRRLYGALSRRGFGGDIVRSVIDQAMVDRP